MPSLQGNWYEPRSITTTSGTSLPRIARITSSGANSSGAVAIGGALRYLLVHAAGKFQVFPRLALIGRGAQQICGMIRDYQRSLEFPEMMHPPPEPAEGCIGGEQVLGRYAADREHNLGLQQSNLSDEVRQAGFDLFGLRVAVIRWAAHQHVGDVDVGATIESDGAQHGIEQLTGRSHERLTTPVLLRSRSFADHQPVGPFRTNPEHTLRARGMQRAATAGAHLIEETLPGGSGVRRDACRLRRDPCRLRR